MHNSSPSFSWFAGFRVLEHGQGSVLRAFDFGRVVKDYNEGSVGSGQGSIGRGGKAVTKMLEVKGKYYLARKPVKCVVSGDGFLVVLKNVREIGTRTLETRYYEFGQEQGWLRAWEGGSEVGFYR